MFDLRDLLPFPDDGSAVVVGTSDKLGDKVGTKETLGDDVLLPPLSMLSSLTSHSLPLLGELPPLLAVLPLVLWLLVDDRTVKETIVNKAKYKKNEKFGLVNSFLQAAGTEHSQCLFFLFVTCFIYVKLTQNVCVPFSVAVAVVIQS